jgi:type VI secretion system secreted protein VgrG
MRTLQSTSLATRTFDYKNPQVGKDVSTPTVGNQGDLPSQTEVYEYTGPYTFLKQDRGDQLSKVRLEEWESRAKRFTGIGSVRRLDVGRWFELQDHPDHTDGGQQNQFAVIGLRWFVENNLPVSGNKRFPNSLQTALATVRAQHAGEASFVSADAGSEGFFLSEAETQRRTVPFRSPFEHRKPRMDAQTATVVGPSSSEVFTDDTGRIKVHMHWDRLNSGDENASCWLRVVYPNAGDDHGGVFIPRIGQEVVITFLGGDCDRPVVSGRVFNGAVKPQWHSHGLLSGYKSKEFGGTGYNQLVLDDATGQNRTQLYSSSAESYLHLGYLIDQQGNTRGNFIGSGFDLKSNAYGAVRAGQGLYVSTYSRGGTASQPLDVKESQQHLVESEGVIEMRSEAAQSGQAEPLQDAHDAMKAFSDATQNSVQGSAAGGSTANGGTGSANGFASPVMLLGSPAGIALSSQKSVHVAATEQINLVTGASVGIAAKKSLVASVGEKISLFAQSAGVKLFAGKGKVELQAQSDNLEITADKTLKVVSTSDSVNVSAQKEITLTAGGATIRIANGNIYIHAPGLVEIKGSNHTFSGPAGANDTAQLPPTQSCSYKFASAAQSGAALVD